MYLEMLGTYSVGGIYNLDTHATHAGHILWLMNLEMLGTYSVGGIPGHTCYTRWTYPVVGVPRNAGYTSCKGYLPETFNPIEVKHARNTTIVQAAAPEPSIIQSCSLQNSKYPGFQSHTKE